MATTNSASRRAIVNALLQRLGVPVCAASDDFAMECLLEAAAEAMHGRLISQQQHARHQTDDDMLMCPVEAAGLAVDAIVTRDDLRLLHAPLAVALWLAVLERTRRAATSRGKCENTPLPPSVVVVGLSGPAGAGKSVLSQTMLRLYPAVEAVVAGSRYFASDDDDDECARPLPSRNSPTTTAAAGETVVVMGVDGYHRPNAELDHRGIRGVKGRPETFDTDAFRRDLRLLRRSCCARGDDDRAASSHLSLPAYDRRLHEPVPAAVRIDRRTCRIVIVEGILLYTDRFVGDDGEDDGNGVFDLSLWLDMPEPVARARVNSRKLQGGKGHEAVEAHYARVDGPNHADMIAAATSSSATNRVSRGGLVTVRWMGGPDSGTPNETLGCWRFM